MEHIVFFINKFPNSPFGSGAWCGIYVHDGSADVGTTSSNIVGSATGNSSIYLASKANNRSSISGIASSGTGNVNIFNNYIGSITTKDTANASIPAAGITGIRTEGNGVIIIKNNVIGSATTANSFYAKSVGSTTPQVVTGIINSGSSADLSITNNTIAQPHE
jgi:hypothetical protein